MWVTSSSGVVSWKRWRATIRSLPTRLVLVGDVVNLGLDLVYDSRHGVSEVFWVWVRGVGVGVLVAIVCWVWCGGRGLAALLYIPRRHTQTGYVMRVNGAISACWTNGAGREGESRFHKGHCHWLMPP